MSDDEALLAAIEANPEEDTPRLVYADWLDEHNQPIRAEFIRVQIEIARVETLPRIDINRYVHIYRRQHDLLDNHRTELLGPLAALRGQSRYEFERGFVSEVVLSADQFHQHQGDITATNPLPRVIVSSGVGPILHFLGFDFGESQPEPRTELVAAIQTEPDHGVAWMEEQAGFHRLAWPQLDHLDVSGCRLGVRNLTRLLRASSFPALTYLDLSANDLNDSAIAAVLNSGLAPRLRRLILGGNDISDAGAIELVNSWPTGPNDRLEQLNLRFTGIGQPGQQALLARFGGKIELF